VLAVAVPLVLLSAGPAGALSEIKREELPAASDPAATEDGVDEQGVPVPDQVAPSQGMEPSVDPGTGEGEETSPVAPGSGYGMSPPEPEGPLPEVQYDVSKLPAEVQRMRQLIIDACRGGDIEKLRPLLGTGDSATQLSLGGIDGDPIDFLKGLAGDENGQEILAILEEVLEAGYVHLDVGEPSELYVWPYFFALPLDKLTPAQRVELFKIVTAGDYEEMQTYGSYIFYRVGITPEGRWVFFVAGE
jgi:hypothetical protein